MAEDNYWNRIYSASVAGCNDTIKVRKFSGSDWCTLEMETNGERKAMMQVRSKEQIEQLHFLLGQLLGIN